MRNKRYPIERLKQWQNDVLDIAKKNLRRDGELRPVAFFLTEAMGLDEDLKQVAIALDKNSKGTFLPLTDASIKPADTVIVVMDMVLGYEQALDVIKKSIPPDQAALITSMEEAGHRFGVENPSVAVAKAVMKHFGMDIKDVVAMAVKLIIKKTDAIAYIKLDETWVVEAKGKSENAASDFSKFTKEHGSLEHHPEAKEALTSFLETDGFVRMVSIPFNRNRPKTGRIIGFGEVKEWIEEEGNGDLAKMEGRFSHLFDKSKRDPKPPVPRTAN
jgi:hypothetical protein